MGRRKKTHEEFVAEVKALVGDEYTVVGRYEGAHIKVEVLHNICGSSYSVRSAHLLAGGRCPGCASNAKKSNSSFKTEVYELVGNEYKVSGEYKGSKEKIEMIHKECNRKFLMTPNNFLVGVRCPECFGKPKKSSSVFLTEVYELVGNEYKVLGEYEHSLKKIKMLHQVCKSEYLVQPSSFLIGSRCPKCRQSKGEKCIELWLNDLFLKYTSQYKLKGCVNKFQLPFDFAIFSDDKLRCLIEYDGKQHYEPITHFGGDSRFLKTIQNDAIKTKYCADNGIPLIRIPYWEYDNIDTILTEKLLPLLYNADKHNAS